MTPRRSGLCPCGSGRKYKHCCGPDAERREQAIGYYNLGTALSDAGRPAEAVENFLAARELAPTVPEVHNNLGLALQEVGQLEAAAASFRAALAIDPRFADALANLHALLLSSELESAINCLDRAAALRPADTGLQFFLGVLLEHAGEEAAAQPHLGAGSADELGRSRLDAWRYIRAAAGTARMIGSRTEAFRIAMEAAHLDGLVLEFGVHFGASLRQIADIAGQSVHGFDSFQGLPEDWHAEQRGSYSTDGARPMLPGNVVLHAGWFADTVPAFTACHPGVVRFLHIDCDLYSSARTVLEALADRIVPGTVIVFDEYLAYEHWRDDEFKAFQEAVTRHGWRYEYLAYSLYTKQVVVRRLPGPA